MPKLTVENYFTTELVSTVDASVVGEIELQLAVAPQSEVGFLIVDYVDDILREEIFYHRKAGTSVFTYGVNRTNPKAHDIATSVQLNDSASLFNYFASLITDHFFMYKTGLNTMYIKGGKVYDNGVYKTIPDKTDLTFSIGTNYLYIEEGVIVTTTDSLTDKFIFGDIILDGGGNISAFNNYNTMALITERTNKILRGSSAPSNVNDGIDGDYFIDDTNKNFYGPKILGIWDSGFSLRGDQGLPGVNPTITIGLTNTGVAGSDAHVNNSGTEQDAVFDFTIPKGDKGDDGLDGIDGVDGLPGEITEAQPETPQTANDMRLIKAGAVVTKTAGSFIKITDPDGSYITFENTTITIVGADGDRLAQETGLSGSWVGDDLSYSGHPIQTIFGATGTIEINGKLAYLDVYNYFERLNTFYGVTVFEGPVVFPSVYNTNNTTTINISNGSKQYVAWTAANTLNMSNVRSGATLLLAVDNISAGDIVLTLGVFTNVDGVKVYNKYDIGESGYPLTIGTGIHMFVCEVFSTGIHISYAGKSTAL